MAHKGRFFTLTSGVGYWVWGVGCGGEESDAVASRGFPPETKPDYVEPLWLVGYADALGKLID